MRIRRLPKELAAVLPWVGAAVLWFGVITPMRADQENRLAEQGLVRRERVKLDRAAREGQSLRTRIAATLGSACRASADPASVRQRAVAATAGLSLSPFTLSVTGGASAGATVEAEGTRSAVLELLRRLGDPARGGFLRSAGVRDKGSRWGVSAITGVLESIPAGIVPAPPNCSGPPDPPRTEASPQPTKPPVRPRDTGAAMPTGHPPEVAPILPTPEPTPAPPFTLIGFLASEGRNRVSLRVGGQVRVISVGDLVDGWRCISIDRDDGALFTSASGERFVLKAGPER